MIRTRQQFVPEREEQGAEEPVDGKEEEKEGGGRGVGLVGLCSCVSGLVMDSVF